MSNEDLEVTSVLDPDMTGKDVELTGQDIDFELDDSLLEDGPDEDFLDLGDLDALDDDALAPPPDHVASSPASQPEAPFDDDDDIDFELTEPVQEAALADDDIDFELSEPVQESVAASEPEMEEVDFDLDQIIADSSQEGEKQLVVAEDELEEPVDFELEEVVEAAPQPEPEPEPEPAMDTGMPEVPEYTPPQEAVQPTESAEPATIEFDAERIEALVEKTIRETVTQVLERVLPGLVEETLSRELEKLHQDLEDT